MGLVFRTGQEMLDSHTIPSIVDNIVIFNFLKDYLTSLLFTILFVVFLPAVVTKAISYTELTAICAYRKLFHLH